MPCQFWIVKREKKSFYPAETYWMEKVRLRSQRQQPETRLQVPGPHARVELLKEKTQTQISLFIPFLSHSLRVAKGANLTLDIIWLVFKGENKCVVGFLLTLLRSLAVTLSSSRHGIR